MFDVTLEHCDWLRLSAAEASPFEVCGFIMRDGSIIEIRNVAENPYDTFTMDLRQIRRTVDVTKIAAIWHTHPGGDIRPSQADLTAIRLCEWDYVIVTADEVALYEPKRAVAEPAKFTMIGPAAVPPRLGGDT